jgi:hypothetical protein
MAITPYTPCTECERPLRPAGAPATTYPDTTPHVGHGLCSACRNRFIRNGRRTQPVQDPALDHYLARRRARIARADRARRLIWALSVAA